ncbi:phosphodiester glycosidase family protein [Falsibacillus pallidus]|uniref:phosphodiester glycosidase family protein n=1 Tax=Falsibacillus pallidus TaxID=493781 RepID=UPI003D9869EB
MHNSILRKTFLSLLAAATLSSTALAEDNHNDRGAADRPEQLSLGKNKLPETRQVSQLAEGATYTLIHRGYLSKKSFYTIDVSFYENNHEAENKMKELRKMGYEATIHPVKQDNHSMTDVQQKEIGYVVRIGEFESEDKAKQLQASLSQKGIEGTSVAFSGYDGTSKSTGPWNIHVIEINPNTFQGKVGSSIANDQIEGKETVSSMVERKHAIAGTNGGYFVVGQEDGTPGDPAGISVANGKLLSESVGNRTSLILHDNHAEIGQAKTMLSVGTSSQQSHLIDGINRTPGKIRSCGGIEDTPTISPQHDVTCTDDSELIEFNASYGKNTPSGKGFEIVLDDLGNVVSTRDSRGGAIADGQTVLSATGEAADWLKEQAKSKQVWTLSNKVYNNGKELEIQKGMDIVNGGPSLLHQGKIDIDAKEEGFDWSSDFYYHFALYRHPRTLVGVKADGHILLVTIDGRNPKNSIGVNFEESAELLKELGAVDGMNLDGGGSSTMVVNGKLVNHPSDATGERPIGDGILISK